MPADDYKIVVRTDKSPIGQHVRQYKVPKIYEVAIIIRVVGEEFNSRDIILHHRIDDVH